MRSPRSRLLFVYGTLRPFVAIPMALWLKRAARYLGPATTGGRLYDLGAYPGLKPARGPRERVSGDVYRIASRRVWRVLDRYEAGCRRPPRFTRVACLATLARGRRRYAWLYLYERRVHRAARIASGDYRRYLAVRD